jgi:pimeloyl-ACP methyl ester carboxylesterase
MVRCLRQVISTACGKPELGVGNLSLHRLSMCSSATRLQTVVVDGGEFAAVALEDQGVAEFSKSEFRSSRAATCVLVGLGEGARGSMRPAAANIAICSRAEGESLIPHRRSMLGDVRVSPTKVKAHTKEQHVKAQCMKSTWTFVLTAVIGLAMASSALGAVKNVVLVHGAFADGSGWKPVADILKRDGYTVYVVQQPLTTFEADLAATRLVLDRSGPCVLVGHSYAGMIISEVGDHAAVRSLVYVAAFEPTIGETAGGLQDKTPPASTAVIPAGGGFVQVKPDLFPADFAADVPKPLARFMAIAQVPIAVEIFGAKTKNAAWSQKPSYAVIAQQDRMINPDLERFMAKRAKSEVIELPGSHAVFLSHPKEVAALIEKAANAAN